MSPSERLQGVLVPVTTPFDPVTENIDLAALRTNLAWLGSTAISGVLIAGTTGEAVCLSRAERRAAAELAAQTLPDRCLLIVGTGAESTRGTLELCVDAGEAGADAVLVQPPSFYRRAMDASTLAAHYRAVAEASPVPVLIYQVPTSCSSVELTSGLIAELSTHPNILGLKDSRGDLPALGETLEGVSPGFRVFIGNGAKLHAALEMGAVGGILGVANLAPADSAAIHESFAAGRASEAGRIQERVAGLHNAIVGALGVPGVKAALDLLGRRGGIPRRPLRPLAQRDLERVREALESAGLLDTSGAPA